jgi:hypothetical protein
VPDPIAPDRVEMKGLPMVVAPYFLSAALVLGALAGLAPTVLLSSAATAAEGQPRTGTGHTRSRQNPAPRPDASGGAPASTVPLTPLPNQSGSGGAMRGGAGGSPAASGGQNLSSPNALQQCMDSWDNETGMTKREWRDTCVRTLKEYPPLNPSP